MMAKPGHGGFLHGQEGILSVHQEDHGQEENKRNPENLHHHHHFYFRKGV